MGKASSHTSAGRSYHKHNPFSSAVWSIPLLQSKLPPANKPSAKGKIGKGGPLSYFPLFLGTGGSCCPLIIPKLNPVFNQLRKDGFCFANAQIDRLLLEAVPQPVKVGRF